MNINRITRGSTASGILDLIRFFAALTVVILHGTADKLIPGYQAVMVFFVLSGYFVGVPALDSIVKKTWSWRDYLLNRLTRLWIVLIPALCLTWIWTTAQGSLFGGDTLGSFDLKSSTFIGNLLFLQGHHISVYGGNMPLWSLSFEFWYYILFPCIALMIWSPSKKQKLAYFVSTLAIGAFMAIVIGDRILLYFLIWVLGVLASVLRPIHVRSAIRHILYSAAWIVAIASLWVPYSFVHVTIWSPSTNPFVADFVVGICYMLLIYIIVSFSNIDTAKASRFTKASTYLAGLSYTLYLVHDPLLNFRGTWRTVIPGSILNTANHEVVRVAQFVIIIVYAWMISRATEANTGFIRQVLSRRFMRKEVTKAKSA